MKEEFWKMNMCWLEIVWPAPGRFWNEKSILLDIYVVVGRLGYMSQYI